MGEDDRIVETHGSWRRRAIIASAIFITLVLIFHRPLLLGLGHRIALHYAAKENLKLEFRLEGNVFSNLTVRNLHAVPTGPSDVESVDVDLVHVDYGLFALLRHGVSDSIRNLEVQSARVVLNPTKGPLHPRPANQKEKVTLPDFFPDRVHLSNATVIVRNKPHDFVMEHANLDLDPRNPGNLKIDKLQLVGGQTWSKISAGTSYANRVVTLRDIMLANDERIRSLNIDASQIAAQKLSFNLDYLTGSGHISAAGSLKEAQSSLDAGVRVRAENVPVGVINKYAAWPENFVTGQIAKLDVDLNGLLNSPRTWKGTIVAQVNDFRRDKFAFDRGDFQIDAKNGVLNLSSADIAQSENKFRLNGSSELPATIRDFVRAPATLQVTASAPDLRPVTVESGHEISGPAEATGKIAIKNGTLSAEFDASAGPLTFADGSVDKFNFKLSASKTFPTTNARSTWFANLKSNLSLDISNVRFRDYLADSISGTVAGDGDSLKVEQFNLRRKQNELSARGRYQLPEDLAKPSRTGGFEFSLNAPELADFWTTNSPNKWNGPLQGSGQIEWKNGVGTGQWSVFGANVRTRDLIFNQLSAQCAMTNNVVYVNDLTASLNERDFVGANGSLDLWSPYHYNGKFATNISDLSKLKPLLRSVKNENELAGSLVIDWEGNGDAAKIKNSGKLKLTLENGRYGNLQSLQANVDATYSPDGLDVPIVFLRSNRMDFQASVQAKGETLEISKIQLDQGDAKYASGYISVPFVWKNLGTNAPLFTSNGKVIANFQSSNIDIKKGFEDFGAIPAASGIMNAKFDAQGTMATLVARLEVEMRDLRSETLPKFEPAAFNLTAEARDGRLSISGKLQQAKIQPMALTANFPIDVPRIAREGKLPDDTPVTAKVQLPRSSVNFLRQFMAPVQELDGDLALDVDVSGTIANPILKGTGDMTVNVARHVDPTLPALQNFKARISFANDTLTLDQFGGELSGGKFTMTGRVTFPKLTEPNLDLQFKAQSALIARNDTLTARTDADIKFSGPLNGVNVTGNIALTNSQFLKNLDLIPIGLPGRPAPQPPEDRPQLSFPQPPVRDWKFDVAIKTKDPVLLRGNLASGGAVGDLHLGGTGLHPQLEGQVRLEKVEATLPFSRLEIAYGFLYFDPNDSLNPKLDLHGTSVIHDYTVHVYIYGTALSPIAVFNSEPPLPQEEIISLLATGATRQELSGNNNVLAGRAAMLLVEQLYHKVFKKGQGTQSSTVFDRLDLDVGSVDPRTGQQQATARFKINDQFVVVGDLGVGGDYRGMVKYLIRFY